MALVRQELPEVFRQHGKLGGVLQFAMFGECPGTDASLREAIGATIDGIMGDGAIVRDCLAGLSSRPLTREVFLGCWADADSGTLHMRGDYTTKRRRKLVNPTFDQLEALRLAGDSIATGASGVPDLWDSGNFAFAFCHPPYGMFGGTPGDVQKNFTEVLALILPRDRPIDIRDWGSPALPDLCPAYFEPGMEWWGVFLFTLYDAANRRVTVIAASTTD